MHFVQAKGILSASNGLNVYRGCTHGCIYCDSRSKCYQMQHDFADVEVKQNAPQLLEQALQKKRNKCMLSTGSMSDPYMHCESQLQLTRKCEQIALKYGFGWSVQTKSKTVLRDVDLLEQINEQSKCVVQTTFTTADEKLCSLIEPNVCSTYDRYLVLKQMQQRRIPTVVWLSPLLPFLCDTEQNVNALLDYCFDAGVVGIVFFGVGTTMRDGSREPFYQALDRHFPLLRQRYEQTYGNSYECVSPNNAKLCQLLTERCAKQGVTCNANQVFEYLRHFPDKYRQTSIFD